MKKCSVKITALLLVSLLLFSFTCLCACGNAAASQDPEDFVGTYKSAFMDAKAEELAVTFTLQVKEDHTFVLNRFESDVIKATTEGQWKSYTESGKSQILCYGASTGEERWNPYFSLALMDDGTLMASTGTFLCSHDVESAFGYGGGGIQITLVFFDKK